MYELEIECCWIDAHSTVNLDPDPFFRELNELNKNLSLKDLSIGMSSDYIKAVENHSTYLRVGSAIFGNRT